MDHSRASLPSESSYVAAEVPCEFVRIAARTLRPMSLRALSRNCTEGQLRLRFPPFNIPLSAADPASSAPKGK